MTEIQCNVYDSPDSFHTDVLTIEQIVSVIGMNEEESRIFISWFNKTFPSTKGIPKAEKEINNLIWRFKFKFIHRYDNEYEFVVYRKRWFDKIWSRIKWRRGI